MAGFTPDWLNNIFQSSQFEENVVGLDKEKAKTELMKSLIEKTASFHFRLQDLEKNMNQKIRNIQSAITNLSESVDDQKEKIKAVSKKVRKMKRTISDHHHDLDVIEENVAQSKDRMDETVVNLKHLQECKSALTLPHKYFGVLIIERMTTVVLKTWCQGSNSAEVETSNHEGKVWKKCECSPFSSLLIVFHIT